MSKKYSSVSIVMPYYHNERTLPECLARLTTQTTRPLEIIVVDDGSQHPALPMIEAHRRAHPHGPPVHHYLGAHGGQSKATNRGIQAAKGDITLLTCADILAHPDLVTEHLRPHNVEKDDLAVMGYIPYADTVKMTPFMQWLCMPARQFCFSLILDPDNVPPKYCYSPNISVQTSILQRVGGFDEKFIYGYQDTDLGLRLEKECVRFIYRQKAIGYHDHPNTVRSFARRQQQVGEATLTMMEKYPDRTQQAKFRNIVQKYGGFISKLPTILDDIEGLEARLARMPQIGRRMPEQLVNLYDFAMVLALVDGMLQYPQRLIGAFDYGEERPTFLRAEVEAS